MDVENLMVLICASSHALYGFGDALCCVFRACWQRIYLDAAFFPKLDKLDFLQEAHRLEFKVHWLHGFVAFVPCGLTVLRVPVVGSHRCEQRSGNSRSRLQ